ncbi:MAG: hypothetical protein WAL22_19860 [Solirubrobacteraceae bacterium]
MKLKHHLARLVAIGALAGAGWLGVTSTASASASWCDYAPGPGNVNKSCVDVHGSGEYVTEVDGNLDASDYPYEPSEVCGVTVHVFGIFADGAHYSDTGGDSGCALGDIEESFYPQGDFQAGSLLCETTEWQGQTSRPVCITIES